MEYIQGGQDAGDGCFLCHAREQDDESAQVLVRADRAFVILNRYPYNPGHVMVAPTRHVGELQALESDEMADVDHLLQRALHGLKESMAPDGFNLGMNLGRVAGAGVPDHVHWHVVPRWEGDTNFMPVLGRTKVLPELLADTYTKLKRTM
jgi:ATP adenylyltransferase